MCPNVLMNYECHRKHFLDASCTPCDAGRIDGISRCNFVNKWQLDIANDFTT